MTIRGIQWRAILVPVGVSAFLIAALSWYGLVWIPSQQRYLNERNIRVLRTIGAQIRSKVDNFDTAIDHALESFAGSEREDARSVQQLGQYVTLFAPELEILDKKTQPSILDEAGKPIVFDDPPRIKIRVDEGKNYLHFFSRHMFQRGGGTVAALVAAKADIDGVVGLYLTPRSEFDVLALVDRAGRVIAQRSSSGVELARVDRLTGTGTAPADQLHTTSAPSSAKSQESAPGGFETLQATGNIADVTIGGAAYRFYVQPVQLALLTADGAEPEEWGLCGLVRTDRFRAESSAISSTYWLLCIAALALLVVSIPLLKLHVLNARERFKGSDGVFVAATTVLITGLLTFALLDLHYFGYAFRSTTDDQLRDLAGEILESFKHEASAAMAELDARDNALQGELSTRRTARKAIATGIRFEDDQLACDPVWACGKPLLAGPKAPERYPYFNLISWTDRTGQQQVKRTTGAGITPFINIHDANLPYYHDLERARAFSGAPQRGISVIRSPNTGDPLTVFWKALPAGGHTDSTAPDLTAVSLATIPLSVVQPVLPKDMQFAVLDTTGLVLFHSDRTRNLNENFFQECEANPALRALVLGRTSGVITAPYLGQRQRLYVTPVELAGALGIDPRWSLVVFQQTLIQETVNLETLTVAAALFAAYTLVLGIGWGLIHLVWPQQAKWFWPDDRKADKYRRAALLNAGLSVVFLALVVRTSPPWLLVGTAIIAVGALAATFAIVFPKPQEPSERDRWQNAFLLARVSLLVVAAMMPAIACFQAAHDFEVRLLVRRGQIQLAREIEARKARVEEQVYQLPLCEDGGKEKCSTWTASTLLERRLGQGAVDHPDGGGVTGLWDVHVLPFAVRRRDEPAGGTDGPADRPDEATRLDRLLAFVHPAYNDVATDLKTVLPGPPRSQTHPEPSWSTDASGAIVFTSGDTVLTSAAQAIQPDFWYWLVTAAVALCLVLLVRFAVYPIFVLDLYVPPGLKPSGEREPNGNLLIVGPPGSGKTDSLRKQSRNLVFDVRTLAYVDPGALIPHVAALGPMVPPGFPPEPGQGPSGSWADAMAVTTLPDGGVLGIDHLEYRLDDPAFRARLLTFLEELLYRRRYRVWIASTREPVDQLQENGATGDLDGWRRLLQSFREETVGIASAPDQISADTISALVRARNGAASSDLEKLILAECSLTPFLLSVAEDVIGKLPRGTVPRRKDVLFEIGVAAEPFYRAVWTACSKDEKLALRQLAEQGVVNPRNRAVVAELLRSGLVRRDPTFKVMNETFRHFILHQLSSDELSAWENDGVRLPWGSITTTMLTMALGLIGLIVLTQQQLVDAWIGFVPALAPAVPTVMKLVAGIQRGPKTDAVAT